MSEREEQAAGASPVTMVERVRLALERYWLEHGYDPSEPDEGAARAAIAKAKGE